MTELFYLASVLNGFILPLVGGGALLLAKLCRGEAARRAERQFLALLVVMTIITVRTVVTLDEAWLIHTATLSIMIVGALFVPNHQTSAVA